MRVRLALLLAAAVSFAAPTPCAAFGYEEHLKLGNLSLELALAYFKASVLDKPPGPDAKPETKAKYEAGKARYEAAGKMARAPAPALSYGHVVACVDYFLYPAKLLAELEARKYELRSREREGFWAHVLSVLTPEGPCDQIGGDFVLATHSNHSHFQNGAIVSYRTLHIAAIAMAQDPDHVQQALAINGMADHFLSDLFAPGHIYTARDRLSDVYATSRHDTRNAEGADFLPANTHKLHGLATVLCGGSDRTACRPPEALKPIAPSSAPEHVAKLLWGVLDPGQGQLKGERQIVLRGDDKLWEENDEQLKQRLYVLLVQAQSIVDLLTGENSFHELAWKDGEQPDWPAQANLAFGEYILEKAPNPPFITIAGLAIAKPDFGSPVFGLSLSREAMTSGERVGRNVASLEMTTSVLAFGGTNQVGTLGITGYQEGAINGWGPTYRYTRVWAATEMALSWYVRWLSYPTESGDTRRFSFGGRLDSGFSSYFTLFLSVGRDYGTSPEHSFGGGWILAGGVQLQVPHTVLTNAFASLAGKR